MIRGYYMDSPLQAEQILKELRRQCIIDLSTVGKSIVYIQVESYVALLSIFALPMSASGKKIISFEEFPIVDRIKLCHAG